MGEREDEGGRGREPLKGRMGGNVPMAPLKPDHVLKGDAFCSSKKNQYLCFHIVLTNPLLAYSNKDLKNIEMGGNTLLWIPNSKIAHHT